MPTTAKQPCGHPGCPALVDKGMCQQHKRPSAAKRGYGRRWKRATEQYRIDHPFCVECEKEGRDTPMFAVDHIRAHCGDERLFWDEDNWQSLCETHHNQKTRAGER